jgi:zinc transport system ATP-binding protein
VGYGSDAVASNINMTVEPGDLLCVIGENGAGKSTLVKTVLGLIQPLGGTLEFAENLAPDSVGYLPQQGETQRDFPASVTEIVLSGCLRHLGKRLFYGPRERATANAAIERVGVADLAKRSFSTLSGGQRQRVLIARALCAATDLLVLDEPTTGLDPNAANELYDTIARLRAEGMGVISVSHDLEAALGHASHVLVVGKHPFFGTVEEYAALRADREV